MANAKLLVLLACCVWVGAPALAGSPFDGHWVADLDTQSGLPTDVYLLREGIYACDSCEPPRRYVADGQPHAIPGDLAVISESVTVAGPNAVVTHIISPSRDRVTTMTVAPDDQTATYVSIDHRPGIPTALRTEYLARRTQPAPRGAHPISGTWQGVRYVEVPEALRTISLVLADGLLTYRTPLGSAYAARLGGDYVPVKTASGDDVTVAVRKVSERKIEERTKRGGQLVAIRTFAATDDGRTMAIATTDPVTGVTFRATSRRSDGAR